ncbi:MAG: YqgE/AlgH family protein, partial [Kiloniellaceae bacterium]
DATGSVAVLFGGPVEAGRGFFLHTRDAMPPGSLPVTDDVAWSADPRQLRALGADNGPRHALLAVGYAGWGPGQLESEIAEGGWFSIPASNDLVFAAHPSRSWARAISLRGIDL